jgi:hypothetical protein
MNQSENKIDTDLQEDFGQERKIWTRNFLLSILIHFILIVVLLFVLNLNNNRGLINSEFFYVETKNIETKSANLNPLPAEKIIDDLDKREQNQKDEDLSDQFISYNDIKADTTNLDQLYKESTLNLSIKYPKGWAFLDQNRNQKLDGVTFWAANSSFNPPPYIHLEVIDKDLFNEKRYHHKIKLYDCEAYYNDPEELSGQLSQAFYLRTNSDEDYQIKLIMEGKENFYAFLPEFWGILKSFRFGQSIF